MEIKFRFGSCYSCCVLSLETGLVIKIVSGFIRGRCCFFLFRTDSGRLSSVCGIGKDHMHSRGPLESCLSAAHRVRWKMVVVRLHSHVRLYLKASLLVSVCVVEDSTLEKLKGLGDRLRSGSDSPNKERNSLFFCPSKLHEYCCWLGGRMSQYKDVHCFFL